MKKLLLPALAILALASCNNEEIQTINEPVAVSFGQSLNLYATTKAPIEGTILPNGTTMGVWGVEYTTAPEWATTGENFMENELLTAGDAGTITYTNTKYYSIVAGTKYDFYAYSPQATADNGIVAPTKPAAIPTLDVTLKTTAADQVDILWANKTAKEKDATSVALGFKHALVQLAFQVKKEAGVTAENIKKITVNANSVATMSLADGSFTGNGTLVDFIAYENATGQAITANAEPIGEPLMIFPEALAANSITFTIGENTYSFVPKTNNFIAGNKTTITVTVKQTSVEFSQTLTVWTPTDDEGEIK